LARDVYNREVDLGQPFSADAARLLFEGGTQDMLVQSLSIQYKQNVTRLWEVGSGKQYFVAGRTEGQFTMNRIVGPKPVNKDFMNRYGDVCQIAGKHLTFLLQAGCGTADNRGRITADGVVLTQVTYQVQAQDMVIQEGISAIFARLEIA
jgi:hypothetical protein